MNMTVTYANRTYEFVVGTFPFKNSTGSNKNRIWCEFLSAHDPDMHSSPEYDFVKGLTAFDKRHEIFDAIQYSIRGKD